MSDELKDEQITIGGQPYRKFILHPGPVLDGSPRCIACGQVDEEPWHEAEFCPGMGGKLPWEPSA